MLYAFHDLSDISWYRFWKLLSQVNPGYIKSVVDVVRIQLSFTDAVVVSAVGILNLPGFSKLKEELGLIGLISFIQERNHYRCNYIHLSIIFIILSSDDFNDFEAMPASVPFPLGNSPKFKSIYR